MKIIEPLKGSFEDGFIEVAYTMTNIACRSCHITKFMSQICEALMQPLKNGVVLTRDSRGSPVINKFEGKTERETYIHTTLVYK